MRDEMDSEFVRRVPSPRYGVPDVSPDYTVGVMCVIPSSASYTSGDARMLIAVRRFGIPALQ
jgi:hypothetical protein